MKERDYQERKVRFGLEWRGALKLRKKQIEEGGLINSKGCGNGMRKMHWLNIWNNKFIYLIKKKKVSSVLLKGVLVQKKELLEVNNE